MTEPLDFHSAGEFRQWLMSNHQTSDGVHIYVYKRGHETEGV